LRAGVKVVTKMQLRERMFSLLNKQIWSGNRKSHVWNFVSTSRRCRFTRFPKMPAGWLCA
jgi:hypothetical protein